MSMLFNVSMLKIPLVESGTAGYLGQAKVMLPGMTECYDCSKHDDKGQPIAAGNGPVSYPVCTIRNKPSKMIHCVVWAKDYRYEGILRGVNQDQANEEVKEEVKEGQKERENEGKGIKQVMDMSISQDSHETQQLSSLFFSYLHPKTCLLPIYYSLE